MRQLNKIHITTSLTLLLLLSFNASATKIKSLLDAVHISNQQTSLGYQLLKNYSQLGQDVRFMDATEQNARIPKLFNANMASLKAYAKDSASALSTMQTEFTAAQTLINEQPSKDKAETLYKIIKSLTNASQSITDQLIAKDKEKTHMVNVAGKQSIYTNQLSSYYLLISWGITEQITPLYEQVLINFEENLDELIHTINTTKEISKTTASINKKWLNFQKTDKLLSGTTTPTSTIRTMDKCYELSTSTSELYSKL